MQNTSDTFLFTVIENSSPFFLVLKKSGSTVLVSGSFLGRLQTRNLSHPSPPVGVFRSQWVRGIHSPLKSKQGQRIVIILGECFHDVTICQHTQLDLEDEPTGRSYPVSSSTPERGLSEMMHTVEKMAIINPQNMECRCCTTQLMAEQSTMNSPAKAF